MSEDARFEDGQEKPLRLMATTSEDLNVISALTQDAVIPAAEMTWQKQTGRFGVLLNRFRWEDRDAARLRGRAFERVQSVLMIDAVLNVASQGIDPKDKDMVMSLMSISFDGAEGGAGRVMMTLAGDGAIGIDVDYLEIVLRDVTRPYEAPSKRAPSHPE